MASSSLICLVVKREKGKKKLKRINTTNSILFISIIMSY